MYVLKICLLFYALFERSTTIPLNVENLNQNEKFNLTSVVELFIPTINSPSAACRNHSLFYLKELKNFKLWATEMYDATSKFSSGVLAGSTYDFGNFDECINVRVPYGDGAFSGRHCMVEFTIKPPSHFRERDTSTFRNEYYNTSVWEKIATFGADKAKGFRNKFHLSFCIPSSCTNNDLKIVLDNLVDGFNSMFDFSVEVNVKKRTCQVYQIWNFTAGDFLFMFVCALLVVFGVAATLYDLITSSEDFEEYKLPDKFHDVFVCFSVSRNLKKLSSSCKISDGLKSLSGLKVFSMFFIIMGHRIMFSVGSPMLNPEFVEDFYNRVDATVLLNGPLIVDTFFILSGFLASFILMTELDKFTRASHYGLIYLHRLIRMLPSYALVIAFYCTVFAKLSSGPLYKERIEVEQERCIASWWANLLFVNNYVNTDKICMFQSWFITCDIHFFLLTPLLVWLLRKKAAMGLLTTFVLIVACIITVFTVVYRNKENAILLVYIKFLRDPVLNKTFKNIYIPSHMRAVPYLVGIIVAYLRYKIKIKDYTLTKSTIYLGWIVTTFMILVTAYSAFIFYIPEIPYDSLFSAFYASMHHFTWSIAIGWMIIALSTGNGSWIEPIFSWHPVVLLSRITYAAFLCHAGIQMYSVAIMRQPAYAHYFPLITQVIFDIVAAYLLGFIISILVEAPINGLEKLIFKKSMNRRKAETKKTEQVDTYRQQISIIS